MWLFAHEDVTIGVYNNPPSRIDLQSAFFTSWMHWFGRQLALPGHGRGLCLLCMQAPCADMQGCRAQWLCEGGGPRYGGAFRL